MSTDCRNFESAFRLRANWVGNVEPRLNGSWLNPLKGTMDSVEV